MTNLNFLIVTKIKNLIYYYVIKQLIKLYHNCEENIYFLFILLNIKQRNNYEICQILVCAHYTILNLDIFIAYFCTF